MFKTPPTLAFPVRSRGAARTSVLLPAIRQTLATWLLAVLLLPTAIFARDASAAAPLVVVTKAGAVEGFNHDKGVVAFRGIPFAQPPVGELRFREPQPAKPWEGIRAAKSFGRDCMQYSPVPSQVGNSEDCLYVNVYKPTNAKAGDQLPVHVWIYGGAFFMGASSLPQYENAADVRDGIVYVNFNYRVNIFGFIAHPELTAESPHGASGNYGLMDQVLALKWVQDNIEQFGGDPANVTVSGASAGACSIGFLMVSPLAKGLFKRALMQSTAGWRPQRTRALQEEWSVKKFGDDIAALRGMPADELLKLTASPQGPRDGSDTLGDGHSGGFSYIDWMPIVDGYVVPKSDRQAWKDGEVHVTELLIGDIENEGLLFMQWGPPIPLTKPAYEPYMRAEYGALADEALTVYPVKSDDDVIYQLGFSTGDLLFSLPAREMSRRMVGRTPNVYRWHFNKHTSKMPVTLHNTEQAYFFGNLDASLGHDETDRAISETMQAAKRRFIKTGNPNGGDLPLWAPYDGTDPYMEFGDKGAVPGTGLRNRELDFAVKAMDARFPLD